MIDSTEPTPRRHFLARFAAAVAAVTAVGASAGTGLLNASPVTPGGAGGPDDVWLDKLTARHRTTFDVDAHKNGAALVQAKNFLDGWRDSFGVPERDVNLVMAVRGTGITIVLRDELWVKYRIGEQYGISDPATGAPSVRNLYIGSNVQTGGPVTDEQTVEALQRRGVLFLVCRNTIAGATKKLVAAGMGTTEQVRESITHGIIPGVIIVPAMVIAFTEMQQRGVAYVYAG
jgi:intracellular sulfur oxidation DsrE/DsrF family protein